MNRYVYNTLIAPNGDRMIEVYSNAFRFEGVHIEKVGISKELIKKYGSESSFIQLGEYEITEKQFASLNNFISY